VTDVLSPLPRQQFFDNNGRPLVNGKLFTYEAGTNTKLATYTDSGGLTQNTNPVILDFRGECNLWIPPNVAYKYVLSPPTDTDPPSNPIWSVDDIVSSQLVTLYGGVDTGSTNAYVLNFTANFTTLTDGIVIYWVPSNTNTFNSTLNVNGLGPVSIRNQDGTELSPGQLVANTIAVVMYKSGAWLLVQSGVAPDFTTGNFNATPTGVSGATTVVINYYRVGRLCTWYIPANQWTSNSTSFGISGIPPELEPTFRQSVMMALMQDNGVIINAQVALFNGKPTHTMRFLKNGSDTGWTGSGTKGIGDLALGRDCVISYLI
jgi:hypothetical protein